MLLDLGRRSSAAELPLPMDPGPDRTAQLSLLVCRSCALVQLGHGMVDAEGPMGAEPRTMRRQAVAALSDLERAGFVRPGLEVAEYSSPHSGDWSGPLREHGLRVAGDGPADIVLDVFGLMHEPDQREAFGERIARLREGGIIVIQAHALEGDIARSAWHVVRHGHYAYYTATVLVAMFSRFGFAPIDVFEYDLQGGTLVLVFGRHGTPSQRVRAVLDRERLAGLDRPAGLAEQAAELRTAAAASSLALRSYLDDCRLHGLTVGAYPASTGSVALLELADVGREDVAAVGDVSADKQGRALPGSRIPIVSPDELMDRAPDRVLLFVPELLDELRERYPHFERDGGRWVLADPYPTEIVCNE